MLLPINFLTGSMSGGEILVILVVMLLLFGANRLPAMARNLGKAMEAFRNAGREVTDEIMRADAPETKAKVSAKAPAAVVTEEPPAPEVKATQQAVHRDESILS